MKTFADTVATWAAQRPAWEAVVLIGSHVRPDGAANAADPSSDWDFQVITRDPGAFADRNVLAGLQPELPLAYTARPTFGGVQRVTALYPGHLEVDFVVLPAFKLKLASIALALGGHRRPGSLRAGLGNLAIVIRPGYRFLKGERSWSGFYRKVAAEIPDPRLGDAEAVQLAETLVCEYTWIRRKLARGECLAAQRALHQILAETNFRLLHEQALRAGRTSYPEARRIERVAAAEDLADVTVSARPDVASLTAATERARATCERLMAALVPTWRWPAGID